MDGCSYLLLIREEGGQPDAQVCNRLCVCICLCLYLFVSVFVCVCVCPCLRLVRVLVYVLVGVCHFRFISFLRVIFCFVSKYLFFLVHSTSFFFPCASSTFPH